MRLITETYIYRLYGIPHRMAFPRDRALHRAYDHRRRARKRRKR